jgi:hypothetical protein
MYDPCLVLPYQRSPSRWYTFVSVFTHTMPEMLLGWDPVLKRKAAIKCVRTDIGADAGGTALDRGATVP